MKKITYIFALFILGYNVGCTSSPSPSPAPSSTVTDDLNRRVTLPNPVEKTVTLAPSLTDLVVAAGATSKIVGVTTADDNPALADSITRFSALPVDFEAVASLQPDVVLATNQINNPRDAETLEALGISTLFFSFKNVDDIPRVVRRLGHLLGTAPAASSMADSLAQRLAAFRTNVDSLEVRPRVLVLISASPLYSFGGNSYVNTMIELAGGQSVTDSLSNASPILSDEFVLNVRPQVIIGTFGENFNPKKLLNLHPTWKHLPAVKNNRVYTIPPNWISRPSPNIIKGIAYMTSRINPALIKSSHVPVFQP